MSGGGARVSIPHSVRKTIQNIKEIAGNHGDEEIYAMLRECSMDPNETAQKLLLQDTFHEVKRKRDKKKESNREPADTRWRPGSQGRGAKGGRGNYSPRYISHDAGGGKNLVKENGSYQVAEKSTISVSSPPTQDTEYKPTSSMSSSVAGLPNGPIKVENAISVKGSASEESGVSGTASVEESSVPIVNNTGAPPLGDAKCSASRQHESSSAQSLPSKTRAPDSGLYASDSDPVLVTSVDAHILGSVGTIKCQGESQKVVAEIYNSRVDICDVSSSELSSLTRKGSSETNNSYIQAKMQGQSQGFEGNQLLDTSQVVSSSSHTSSAGSRPSSNYSSRSQQLNGPQKVGPAKEWKPKSGNIIPSQAPVTLDSSNSEAVIGDVTAASLPASSSIDSEDPTSKLQKRLEELQFSETRHVIIPNHLQVPESERIGLSFGSFDSNFGLTARFVNELESDKSSTHLSESSQDIEENVEEPISGIEKASLTSQEAVYPAPSQSSEETPDNFSSKEPDISSGNSTAKECDQLKPEAAAASEGAQFSVVHTTPSYSNFGVVPQVLGSQFATFDSAEPQARDASRLPGFVVQQPFDPSTSYYTSMYRPAADSDGRFTPVLTLGAAPKYNGNIAVLPSQAGQSPQENGNSLVLSPTGQTPLVTQATGMQSSVPVSQQSVPVFRQPASVQIPHFPPNYMPYNQYFSPYYIPHPFLSNAAFPQQPPTGGIYPPPVAAAGATPIKYSVSQYKSATNTGSPALGTLTGYGAYGPAVTGANSTDSEDLNSAQYKENNVFIAGQQSEAPAVWIPTPGRDISVLQATSFYNLPPQGHQHVTFAPTQVSHGAFPGIYQHPAQTVAAGVVHPMLQQSQAMAGPIEMVGPPGVYQQPQRAQVNWVNNY